MPVALNGSTSKLTFSGTMPTGLPISIFCWLKLDATGMGKVDVPFGFGDVGATRFHRAFINGSAGDEAYFQNNDGGGSTLIAATSTATQDTWMPLLITHAGTTGKIYFRSGSVVSSALDPITWGSIDRFAVGYGPHTDEHFLSGEVTRVCVWTSELTQGNFDSLATTSTVPSSVASGSVWEYWALANSSDLTGANGKVLTAVDITSGGLEPDGSGGSSATPRLTGKQMTGGFFDLTGGLA